jgi:hypothetical protein
MKSSTPANSQDSNSSTPRETGFSPWQLLKSKRISYLTLPLLVMATITEFVILATGWKYQQTVCLPQGMGVTFFGIGPIGATILAVELLKLPLAIWTASRTGWTKGFMLFCGLPLICVLTFQLVKDMAVYEMGVALTPASQMLEKAMAEEIKIVQLNGELKAIEVKKTDRDAKLAELAARKAKSKAEFEESLKRNEESRHDAISLTDYQKKELSEVEARQAAIIQQFDADAAQLNKSLADLRARREVEVGRAGKWNAEDARIENEYKTKMAEYTNQKNAYEKAKAEYESANFLMRKLMKEPVAPGVPPEREVNTILKPTAVAELDAQIKAKESELAAVNNRRRDRVAQVSDDARRLREDFDHRSTTKREEADKKREELLVAQAASEKQFAAEEKQIDQDFTSAAQKIDSIRAELDSSRKKAETYYEAREAAIKNTQVHRIATTVEIVRGLIMGQRPVSIKSTAKERGDLYTDQISMVRIWVYPVLAFIVAFLPTLMVEIGFSTVFKPENVRPPHRLGFFGRRLHQLYIRAGRQKILRAERLAGEVVSQIAASDQMLAEVRGAADKALFEKDAELIELREKFARSSAEHEEQVRRLTSDRESEAGQITEQLTGQLKKKEAEWVAKFTELADSLNRAITEKDALRDLQKSEIERQIQMRQNAWSDRLTQLRKELDDQRIAAETERTTLMQEHQRKLLEVTEDCKTQVIQTRRQMGDAELAAAEKTARLSHDLKEALAARDQAEAQLKHQADFLALKLSQAEEDAARELEKAARQEKYRSERQQADFEKTLRQREEGFERRLQQREQELALAFDARLLEEKTGFEQSARERETELAQQFDGRVRELNAQWNREIQQREEVAQAKLKQRELQLQAQAELRLRDAQTQTEEQLRRRDQEIERQLEAKAREVETRLRDEIQQKELAFHAKLKQREQELTSRAATREAELQNQWASDLRAREEELKQQADSRVRSTENRLALEAQQTEENFQLKLRQREQQLQSQFDARFVESQSQRDQELRRRDAVLAEASQREQELVAQLAAQKESHDSAKKEWQTELEKTRMTIEPLRTLLARAEKERDEAVQTASESHRQVQDIRKKSMEAFSMLNGWRNGDHVTNGQG